MAENPSVSEWVISLEFILLLKLLAIEGYICFGLSLANKHPIDRLVHLALCK